MSYARFFQIAERPQEDENSGGGARKLTQLNSMGAGGTGIKLNLALR